MRSRLEWLIGRWEPSDGSSAVVFEIKRAPRGVKVSAFNQDDGEVYVVSKVKWDGKALRFELSVPSNKWRTKSCLRPVSQNEFIQEITFWEPWKKVPESFHAPKETVAVRHARQTGKAEGRSRRIK